jgi:hypothetical protein
MVEKRAMVVAAADCVGVGSYLMCDGGYSTF